jgi:hypothetical protein
MTNTINTTEPESSETTKLETIETAVMPDIPTEPIPITLHIFSNHEINITTAELGVFNNIQLVSVSGVFNLITIEDGDSIEFENGSKYVAHADMNIDYERLISVINAELEMSMLNNSSNLSNKIQSIYPVVKASPRIRYLLGINVTGDSNHFDYCPSNAGSPFIIIDTNLSTELYTGFPKKLTAGSIGSVTPNMYMQASPFSLDGFSLNNISCNNTLNLKFIIRDIHNEPMKFNALLKWTITVY